MRGDESASTPTIPPLPIKTMSLAPVTPSGPHSPQHLLTTAIHTLAAVSPNHHYMQCSSTAQNPSSEHVLTPYVVKELGGRGVVERLKEKPLVRSASQGGLRLSPAIHRNLRGNRQVLHAPLGWWSWGIKGVQKAVIRDSTCQAHASERHPCSLQQQERGHWRDFPVSS